uniref:Putative secreted protein n=1 Tax=Ixodes ricinus TaxID=34613 RepID=A0A6B0U824_IXORI
MAPRWWPQCSAWLVWPSLGFCTSSETLVSSSRSAPMLRRTSARCCSVDTSDMLCRRKRGLLLGVVEPPCSSATSASHWLISF